MRTAPGRTARFCLTVLVTVMWALAGPNKDARIVVDQDADTPARDSSCAATGAVHVAVCVDAAVSVTGFMVRIAFDSTTLKFVKAELTGPGSGEKPYLERNGGVPGPTLVKAADAGTVDIAAAVKSAEGVAVAGEGLLVYLTFMRLKAGVCAVTVCRAQLSDAALAIDTITGTTRRD